MKHIEKRFLNEVDISSGANEILEALNDAPPHPYTIHNIPSNFDAFFISHDNKFFKGFQLIVNGKKRIIPEPDPILLYFHTAYIHNRSLAETRKKILALTEQTLGVAPPINELYNYFGTVSSLVIFLFTTIEATMNRCIPANYIYHNVLKKKTEIYTKEQIERTMSFEDKLKKVLFDITQKQFQIQNPNEYRHILNLKDFRDDIIHTKNDGQGDDHESHNYSRAFSFDYIQTMEAVKTFCNFYIKPDFIVDCPCSNPD